MHAVLPIALKKYKVFHTNAREYTTLHTKNFGDVIFVEVGALNVGKIVNDKMIKKYKRGDEKGRFEFGGSTIILFVKENEVIIDNDILLNSTLGKAFTNLNLYDFYKGEIQNNSMHRAVAVITSKQMVFYAQLEPDKEIDKESHAKIATLLHNQLEPGVDKCFPLGDFDGDAHIFSAGKYVIIDLPNNGQLSKMQAYFIITILNQFKKLNTRVANGENKINIFFCSYNPKYKEAKFNPYDINAMKSAVLHSITPNFMVHEEKIIGKTLPDERVLLENTIIKIMLITLKRDYLLVFMMDIFINICKLFFQTMKKMIQSEQLVLINKVLKEVSTSFFYN